MKALIAMVPQKVGPPARGATGSPCEVPLRTGLSGAEGTPNHQRHATNSNYQAAFPRGYGKNGARRERYVLFTSFLDAERAKI
jgi:hypothetical protein